MRIVSLLIKNMFVGLTAFQILIPVVNPLTLDALW